MWTQYVDLVVVILVVVGCLNWGLFGLTSGQVNVVEMVDVPVYVRQIIYFLIAIAGIWLLVRLVSSRKEGYTYLEEPRGNPKYESGGFDYPPCYNICGASRKIYEILSKNKIQSKYRRFLDMHSIVLCQEVHTMSRPCDQTMLRDRIAEARVGIISDTTRAKVAGLVNNKTGPIVDFLEAVTQILEDEMTRINSEVMLTPEEKTTIREMNETFYKVHYGVVADKC